MIGGNFQLLASPWRERENIQRMLLRRLLMIDDGAGLDYPRIEARARERGLIAPDHQPSERELAQMIFAPGARFR